MSALKIVCAGFGGQGVLSLGQLVAMMAMKKGYQVSWMPSYGPEMRGGTANCHVVIDKNPIASPIITDGIDVLLAMNQPSLTKFLPHMNPKGTLIANASMVKTDAVPIGITVNSVDFTAIAQEVGNLKVQNMAALGTVVAKLPIFEEADGLDIIEEKFGAKAPDLNALNKAAFTKAFHQ